MSAVFAQRVVVEQAGEPGVGLISVADARLKPGDVVEIEVHAVRPQAGSGPQLKQTRTLALDLPPDYSTNFETCLSQPHSFLDRAQQMSIDAPVDFSSSDEHNIALRP